MKKGPTERANGSRECRSGKPSSAASVKCHTASSQSCLKRLFLSDYQGNTSMRPAHVWLTGHWQIRDTHEAETRPGKVERTKGKLGRN